MTPGVSEGRCLVGVLIIVGLRSQKFPKKFFYFRGMKTTDTFNPKNKVNRPGIHSKTKTSKNKNSKNYKKAYRGQGR
jgi:hypothetical protein